MNLWENVRDQARDAGVDPDDPALLRYATEAPTDQPLYDQITWLINKVRGNHPPAEKKARAKGKKPVASIEELLTEIHGENIYVGR